MLTAAEFAQRVATLPFGKRLPEAIYLHRETLSRTDPGLSRFVEAVGQALKVAPDEWNLVKLGREQFRLSLLHYPDFFSDAYPTLRQSVTVDLSRLQHRVVIYDAQDNPPILHRKEQMLWPEHPSVPDFYLITQEGEAAGLYAEPRKIGFKQSWERLIAQHGYALVDGRLFRQSMLPQTDTATTIDRHKTALVRYQLSAPMKLLAKHGYLNGEFSVFDYGCGRGDDLRELQAHGIDALGWDPNFRPEAGKHASALVNLGYVINVIEDPIERVEALLGAWALCQTLLVVSAMLASDDFIAQFKPYGDGIITSRNTFQKYYNQSELRGFLERTLDEVPIAVAPGIFYLFKDKQAEQAFLSGRLRRQHGWHQLTQPNQHKLSKLQQAQQQTPELFEAFWQRCLDLGRLPIEEEFPDYPRLKELAGSPARVLHLLERQEGTDWLEQARQARSEDLSVYLALTLFDKRRPYRQLTEALKRDIKAFFGDYPSAMAHARELLFAIASPEQIEDACHSAHEQLPASLYYPGHSLLLHKQYLSQLPPLLRVYVGAACQLYGELDEIEVIKVHSQSGKVSLLGYDDFTQPIPYLVERIKIRMAEQEVDFFDYVDAPRRPPLLNKSYLLPTDHPDFAKQRALEQHLGKLFGLDLQQDLNLSRGEFEAVLSREGKMIKCFRIHVTNK
ncbi:DNA phosphorothioation-associated putative methyltransferase [Pseudaeromonas paramecii]|uniref:DNA phosphorothioation-associated methyltransferase n=1 Tax=Pseudaeromonas paramecii TaxID=2138166 RepID=A0ABP8PVK0_9GAMM